MKEVKKTIQLTEAYDITATPNIIINCAQKSYMTNLTMVDNIAELFEVIEFLIHQEQSSSHLVENNSLLILQILNFNHIVNSYFIINQVICYILWPR